LNLGNAKKTVKVKILLCILFGALTTQAQTNSPAPITQTNQVFVEKLEVAERVYTNCTVRAFNPAQAIISFDGGGSVASIADLPTKLQAQFNYDPVVAKNYLEKQRQKKLAQDRFYAQQAALALPPGYAALASISNQIVILQRKLTQVTAKSQSVETRYSLQLQSGQKPDPFAETRRRDEYQSTRADISKQIAALELQAFEIRQTYKIPKPK
jgi:hypothetical protein